MMIKITKELLFLIAVSIAGITLTVVFGVVGLIPALLLFGLQMQSMIYQEQILTNALLVEVLVEMNPELEEDCGGDCENCICDKAEF